MKPNYSSCTSVTKIELYKMFLHCLKELLFYIFKMYVQAEIKCFTNP